MLIPFYSFAAIAWIATILAITRKVAVHSLLYLVVSFLGVAALFFMLGAPFLAALQVMIYAGAILVLFVFVVMMLNIGTSGDRHESTAMSPRYWAGPAILSGVLLGQLLLALYRLPQLTTDLQVIDTLAVSKSLFGPYALATELASMLLLAGLVAAFHLGRRRPQENA